MLSCIGKIFKKPSNGNVSNISVVRGEWAEGVACEYLKKRGWKIVGKNVRPSIRDRRKEIDIIAYDGESNQLVFVEVKTHIKQSEYPPRLWSINSHKKKILLSAFRIWLSVHKWSGNYRFDVIEVYGRMDEEPVIDHIENVHIFPPSDRFRRYG